MSSIDRSRLPFEIVREPVEMRRRAEDIRRDGLRIGLVPTMGFLHAGHESLLHAARAQSDVVILTIFVNPTQFGPREDLSRYPRDEASDVAMARRCGVDLVFAPTPAAMYPAGYQAVVEVRELAQPLCGASRPGHFTGVASVVTKLFHLTQPHVAFFGDKDYQQLAIIRRMVRDLDFGIEIVGLPIVREADGVAMSSRNVYLSAEERAAARSLSAALGLAEDQVRGGERGATALAAAARARLESEPRVRIDYVELRDADDLSAIERLERPAVLALAAFVGTTRLIDNRVLRP